MPETIATVRATFQKKRDALTALDDELARGCCQLNEGRSQLNV